MKNSEDKKIRFGLSITQGLAGGMLGCFAYLVLCFSQGDGTNVKFVIVVLPYFLLTFAILGCIKATIMWGVFRLIGTTLRALARVSISTITSTLLVALAGLYFEANEDRITDLLIPAFSLGIPVALMVGSSVKPWELFTFGSIAAGEVDHRVGSRSILATAGSLPLRFLGIGTTVLFLLYLIYDEQPINTIDKIVKVILLFALYGAYPMFSAYVTFRSPRKIVLIAFGVMLNAPIALLGLFSYSIYTKAYWLGDAPLIISKFCGSFVIAWVIFLVARLSANITPAPSLSIRDRKSIEYARNLDHECLGSRFAEWQER